MERPGFAPNEATALTQPLDLRSPPERVAVVLMSAVGDTIRGMPIVASLREAWPDTHITWVLQPGPANLMRGRSDIDEVVLFHRDRGLAAYPDFRRRVREHPFDLVIDLQPVFKGGVVTRLLPARTRLGYDRGRARDLSWLGTDVRIPGRPIAHIQDELFEFLDALGIEVVRSWDFHFSDAERERQRQRVENKSGPELTVVTRSSTPARDWTLEGTARVIDIARHDLGLDPVLVGRDSSNDLADARRLSELCDVPPRTELGGGLRELAGQLAVTDLLLSPDTGPVHMAVALETPTVGLYGHTDPKRHGPYERFAELTVDRYSRPGETRPSRATRRNNMAKIKVTEVVEKLELALRRYVKAPT